MTLVLHYAPDNASLCVRLALEASGMPYRTALVDRGVRAQDRPEYRRFNPHGMIPALETPDGAMFETGAILLWLSEQRQGAGLMPQAGQAGRAQALSWLLWLANSLHPLLRSLFYPGLYVAEGSEPALTAATQRNVAAALDRLSAAPDHAWLSPGAATAHVCYLAPMLRWLALYPAAARGWFDLQRWPRLLDVAKVTEAQSWAIRAAQAEGLGMTPFSAPSYPNPPEGTAT